MSADMGTEVELSLTVPERELRTARKTIQDGIGDVQVGVQTGTGAASRATGGGGAGGATGRMQRRTFRWARQRTEDINDILAILQDIEGKIGQGGGGGGGLIPRIGGLGGLGGLLGGGGLGALALGGVTVTAGALIGKVADIGPEDVIDTTLKATDILSDAAAFPITATAIIGSGLAVTAKDVIKGDFPITTGDVVDTTIEATDILAEAAAFPLTAAAIVGSGLAVTAKDVIKGDFPVTVDDIVGDSLGVESLIGGILASVPLLNAATFLDNVLGDGFPIDPSAIVDGEGETGETGDPSGKEDGFDFPTIEEIIGVGAGAAGGAGILSLIRGGGTPKLPRIPGLPKGMAGAFGPISREAFTDIVGEGNLDPFTIPGAGPSDGGPSSNLETIMNWVAPNGQPPGFIGQATAAPGYDPADTPTVDGDGPLSPQAIREYIQNTTPEERGRQQQQPGAGEVNITINDAPNPITVDVSGVDTRQFTQQLKDAGVDPDEIQRIKRKIEEVRRGTR